MSLARRVLVAGTSGGVGTTTVTALLFSAMTEAGAATAPTLADHTGGDLGTRLSEGDDTHPVDTDLLLHDLGAHATTALIEHLAEPQVFGVIVAATSPYGFAAAHRALAAIRDRHGASGVRRVFVAAVGSFGTHPTSAATEALQNEFGRGIVVVVPPDPALAAGGRVPRGRISDETRVAQTSLADQLRERMRGYRAPAD